MVKSIIQKLLSQSRAESSAISVVLLPQRDDYPDITNMSPKELADFGYELYLCGTISLSELELMTSCLHLDNDEGEDTIRFSHKWLYPLRKRNIANEWHTHIEIMRKYLNPNNELLKMGEKIITLISALQTHNTPRSA